MMNRKIFRDGIFFAEVYSVSEKVASITWNRLPLSRFAERMSADFFDRMPVGQIHCIIDTL